MENADTVSAYINIETPTGTIALKKTSEDGVVEGISFTIKGDNFNKTVKTGKDGSVSVEGLFPGTYTVTEQSIDRYEPQKTQTVPLIGGKSSTVTFSNTLKRGSLEIVKTSKDNLVEGMKFHLYGTSLSGLCGIIKKNKEVNHMEYKIIAVNRDETIDTIVETLSEDEYIEMLDRKIEKEILTDCIDLNIGVIAYSSLEQGALSGKCKDKKQFGSEDIRNSNVWFKDNKRQVIDYVMKLLKPYAEKYQCTIAQLVIAWTFRRTGITSVLCGARVQTDAIENVEAVDIKITSEDLEYITTQTELRGLVKKAYL